MTRYFVAFLVFFLLVATLIVVGMPTRESQASAIPGVKDVAISSGGGCALMETGEVFCWGGSGETLGDGVNVSREDPQPVAGGIRFMAIAAIERTICALRSNGAVYCWGSFGEDLAPVPTALSMGAVAGGALSHISGGVNSFCGIGAQDRRVYCWGVNDHGQLGVSSPSFSIAPIPIGLNAAFSHVSVGWGFACAITADSQRTLYCWGRNDWGQLGNNSTSGTSTPTAVTNLTNGWEEVAAGLSHTCAVRDTGQAFCWGEGVNGSNGNSTFVDYHQPTNPVSGSGFSGITSGTGFTCGFSAAGLVCWGYNGTGQLGDGTRTNRAVPVTVAGVSAVRVVVRLQSACAIAVNGVFCWGSGISGIVPDGRSHERLSPSRASLLGDMQFTMVDGGDGFACALRTDGAVLCWGKNNAGQLGQGTWSEASGPAVVSGGVAEAVAVGRDSACALRSGAVYCWGYNASGQLGVAPDSGDANPVAVSGAPVLTQIDAGGSFACGLTSSGAAYCWGANESGQLGQNDTSPKVGAVQVGGGHTFTSIALGESHACAIDSSKKIWCWGKGDRYQLGSGTSTNQLLPVSAAPVSGDDFVQLAAGEFHTCGRSEDGKLFCWGTGPSGQLGPTSSPVLQPTQVGTDLYSSLTVGNFHTCGRTQAGQLRCWGENSTGALGDGTTANSTLAVVSPPVNGVVLGAGTLTTYALDANGRLYAWGTDLFGELGATEAFSLTPRRTLLHVAASVLQLRAVIEPYLELVVTGLAGGGVCNGATLQGATSLAAQVSFGELSSTENRIGGQQLRVTTNAASGYVTTLHSAGPMVSGSSTIPNLKSAGVDVPNSAPIPFSAPGVSALGYSTDHLLDGANPNRFVSNKWAAMSTSPAIVALATEPIANDETRICYQVGASPLLPAGAYQTSVTYRVTPHF